MDYFKKIFVFQNTMIDLNDKLGQIIEKEDKINSNINECEKVLANIIEYLLSEKQIDENFDIFCEYQMIEKIIKLSSLHNKNLNIIIIKYFSLLIPSIQDNKILFYFFSNNYMNKIIINISYNIEEQDNDFLSYYINFLKTVTKKLEHNTLSLFFDQKYNKFPLLDKTCVFLNSKDVMIKNTSRNIFLSIIKLKYKPLIEYICNIPRITSFLLLVENIKSHIIILTSLKNEMNNNNNLNNGLNIIINNNYHNYKYNTLITKMKDIEEVIIEDILFIQDILSVGISKINYILTNCLFFIPLQYLFNYIITHQNSYVSFFILNLLFKHLKDECIKNLITLVLYSSQIHANIIEIIANEEPSETYKLLHLNNFILNNDYSHLSFENYLLLNYSKEFLKSIRHIKEDDEENKIYTEIKDIRNQLLSTELNIDDDIHFIVKFLNLKIENNFHIIQRMQDYHCFISRATGINCGISQKDADYSFLQVINKSFNSIIKNEINKKKYFQENILKKECLSYIFSSPLGLQINRINELFLLYHIINDKNISYELKKNLNINKPSEENKSSEDSSKSLFIDINAINFDPLISEEFDNKTIKNLDLKNKSDSKGKNSQFIENGNIDLNKKKFYNSEYKPKENIFRLVLGETESAQLFENNNNVSNIKNLTVPYNERKNNISNFDSTLNLIIEKNLMLYTDFNYNNDYFEKLSDKNISACINGDNIDNENENNNIINKLINLVINKEKILSKVNYKICNDILIELLVGSSDFWYYKRKYQDLINENYRQELSIINELLAKNYDRDKKIFLYSYQYFEESFNLNQKKVEELENEYFNDPILLLDKLKIINYRKELEILKIPEEKYQLLKCLFQKIISLFDLRQIINNYNNINEEMLIKNQKFPLSFLGSEWDINKKIPSQQIENVLFKKQCELLISENYEKYTIILHQNFIFLVKSCMNENENNSNELIITFRFPLRQISIFLDKNEEGILKLCVNSLENRNDFDYNKESGITDFDNNDENNKNIIVDNNNTFEYKLKFENNTEAEKTNELIDNSIKNSILMEYSSLKSYFDNLINVNNITIK